MKRILIIDDEVDFAESLADILKEKGFFPLTSNSPHDALQKVRAADFDLVLLDIKMPGMNGVELLKHIRTVKGTVPIIMLTAFAVEELLQEARTAGVAGILNKPVDIRELMILIESQ